MMPFQILGIWFRGLLSIVLLILGPYLVYRWYERSHVLRPVDSFAPTTQVDGGRVETRYERRFEPDWGFNKETAMLVAGVLMFLWAVPKGPALNIRRMMRRPGPDEPKPLRSGTVERVTRPDGTELQVETYGDVDGPPVVFIHGWGLDSDLWYYIKKGLTTHRVIVMDLPGLGLSKEPENRDYSLDKLSGDLDAVLNLTGGNPAVVVGHSIGGMIALNYCKRFPEAMGQKLAGLVIVHSTYTNPLKTTKMAALKSALQKPLIEPLLHLTIWTSPLVRLMNWLSYWNGSAHSSTERSGFSGNETRGQLDFIAGYNPRTSPAVLARGMFGMLRYDATETLKTIRVPTLVIAGDKDPLCKIDASERMATDIPGATLEVLKPAKHNGHLEHHERFLSTLQSFLSARNFPQRT